VTTAVAPAVANPDQKTSNLALVFQEVFTVVLRTRVLGQRVESAEYFRTSLRQMISSAVKDASAQGYSDEISRMSIYAIIAFVDESILNSKDPVFADWARRPLQEEMFGAHVAGEMFFKNLTDLLNRPDSSEVADALELHALCLMLGYRGKFAFGDASEIQTVLQRIRDKIVRIRGSWALFRSLETPAAPAAKKSDAMVTLLKIAAILLVVFTVLAYAGYFFFLGQSVSSAATSVVG
jgi:type VI secretion system protein ImpK